MKINNPQLNFIESHQPFFESQIKSKKATEKNQIANGDIFIKTCIFKNESCVLSPLIFTKKLTNIKLDDRINPNTMVLECLLALVNKFYYKSTYDVKEFLRELFQNFENQSDLFISKNDDRNGNSMIRKSKRIKKKAKDRKINHSENLIGGKEKEQTTVFEETNILDYLVSPIKVDICPGFIKRKLDN